MRRLPAYLLAALLVGAAAPGVSAQTNYGAGYPYSGAAGAFGNSYGGYPSYSGSSGYSAPSLRLVRAVWLVRAIRHYWPVRLL